jgi:hypothetical protein
VFTDEDARDPIPLGIKKRAEDSAKNMVFTFYDDDEYTLQYSRRNEVDT